MKLWEHLLGRSGFRASLRNWHLTGDPKLEFGREPSRLRGQKLHRPRGCRKHSRPRMLSRAGYTECGVVGPQVPGTQQKGKQCWSGMGVKAELENISESLIILGSMGFYISRPHVSHYQDVASELVTFCHCAREILTQTHSSTTPGETDQVSIPFQTVAEAE